MTNKFYNECLCRLKAGAIEYGDESFYAPVPKLVQEINEELLDVVNWSAILASPGMSEAGAETLADIAHSAKLLSDRLQTALNSGAFDGRKWPDSNCVGAAELWLEKVIGKNS